MQTDIRPAEPLLDQGGTAAYLGVSERTLEGWRTRKRKYGPRYMKIGGGVRYRQTDLDRWLQQQTVDPSERAA